MADTLAAKTCHPAREGFTALLVNPSGWRSGSEPLPCRAQRSKQARAWTRAFGAIADQWFSVERSGSSPDSAW